MNDELKDRVDYLKLCLKETQAQRNDSYSFGLHQLRLLRRAVKALQRSVALLKANWQPKDEWDKNEMESITTTLTLLSSEESDAH